MAKDENTSKSIIPTKYQGRYKEKDWLGEFIDDQATDSVTKTKKVKDDEGNEHEEEVATSERKLNLEALFELCEANHIDTAKMREQVDRPNAPGRIRMTLGNSLRAAMRKRHGLYDVDGDWIKAPSHLVEGEPTENPDGSKIKKAKDSQESEAA